uniref:PPM-type phosphatase domain-containing protein n=1 Tax=Heterorhabditis bacteriophora TaxID=37862 RepID=A0A1I7WMH9_HETBA
MDLASRVVSAMARSTELAETEHARPPRIGMVVDLGDANFIGGFIPCKLAWISLAYMSYYLFFFILLKITQSIYCNLLYAALVEKQRYPYSRPEFLYFSDEEIVLSGDQSVRPVLCPKYPTKMPLFAGYAEVINAGKTVQNEDQGSARLLTLVQQGCEAEEAKELEKSTNKYGDGICVALCMINVIILRSTNRQSLLEDDSLVSPDGTSVHDSLCTLRAEAALFVVLDGHAGTGSALVASKCLHEHVKVKKRIIYIYIIIIIQIKWLLYLANAGDCRAVLVTGDGTRPLSQDFTPATERKRLQTMVIASVLFHYRDWFMDGWAVRTVKEADLRPPLINDSTRKKRLLNTIGVSRGFGDHHLMTVDERLPIKPFLSPVPEVQVFDLRRLDSLTDKDVLIMASDGLWDVLSNEDAGLIVRSALSTTEQSDHTRYSMAAQELAIAARGNPGGSNGHRWIMNSGGHASTDDITVRVIIPIISVFVIPLKHCMAPPLVEEDDDDMLSLSEDS